MKPFTDFFYLRQNQSSGFTMVEVIIVLSILTVLTTTSVLGYTHFLRNARDSRRQVDLNTLSTVLQEYRKTNGEYPDALNDLTTSTPPYLDELPVDPKDAEPQYGYSYSKTGNTYSLSALFENGEYYVINPYGSNFVSSNPQNITPTPSAAFPTRTPTPTPPDVEFAQTYKYYAPLYAKAHPWGDLQHYQYTYIVLNNVTNSPATVKFYIKNYEDGSNLITSGDYIERTIDPKSQYNTYSEPEVFLGLDTTADPITDNGNITTTTTTDGIPDHTSALGWTEIVSDKPLAGYNRIMVYDGPTLTDNLADFDDESLQNAGNNQFFVPVFVHDTDTGDGNYKQSTDIDIVNPHAEPTTISLILRDSAGQEAGSITQVISSNARWSSWAEDSWLTIAGSAADTDGFIGTLEIVSDTTNIFPMVRQRLTIPGSNSYTDASKSTDNYFAHHKAFDDERPLTQEEGSRSAFTPLYLKKHNFDEVDNRWQWNDIQIMNIEDGQADITIDIYKPDTYDPDTDTTEPYHSITKTIESKGSWGSYDDENWQLDDATLPVPTTPATNPNGIPAMTDLGSTWGVGWISITSNKQIIANNRTTIRDPGTDHPSNRNELIVFDDEPFLNSSRTSTKLYETHMLRNWPGAADVDGPLRQFTNPVLINPNAVEANVNVKLRRIDTGALISEFDIAIEPNGFWNARSDTNWLNVNNTWYGDTPEPDPAPLRTNAWTEITSSEPLFGMHRMRFHQGNSDENDDPNTEIKMFDDDTDALFYAEDIFACIDDTDCDGNLVCSDNECVLP